MLNTFCGKNLPWKKVFSRSCYGLAADQRYWLTVKKVGKILFLPRICSSKLFRFWFSSRKRNLSCSYGSVRVIRRLALSRRMERYPFFLRTTKIFSSWKLLRRYYSYWKHGRAFFLFEIINGNGLKASNTSALRRHLMTKIRSIFNPLPLRSSR